MMKEKREARKKKGTKNLTYTKRLILEDLLKAGMPKKRIAEKLGVCLATVYNEIKRGEYIHKTYKYTDYYGDRHYVYEKRYSADKAQELYELNLTTHGAPLKIGKSFDFMNYIERRVLKDKISPCAVLGEIKRGNLFNVNISKTTLYRYIDDGVFLNLEMKHLPMYRRKKIYRKATAKRPPKGTSIEQRPKEIFQRTTFGHWEMDCIIGKQYTRDTLLVFTERLTRYVIVLKMPNHKALTVVNYVDLLEERYGELFPTLFKSITVDNGVEFSNYEGLEHSKNGKQRTKVYYCHPYTSCERGSNERMNRDIRRQLPKGTDFRQYSDEQIQWVEDWVNAYPREMFGYATAKSRFQEELEKLCA